jgi:hypothetical protein
LESLFAALSAGGTPAVPVLSIAFFKKGPRSAAPTIQSEALR